MSVVAGLVLLGGAVWGVVHAGQGLRAPPPVGGDWELSSPPNCPAGVLHLSQSGVFLRATWELAGPEPGTVVVLDGLVDVDGELTLRAKDQPPCGVSLELTGSGRDGVQGLGLVADGCGACPAAVLQAKAVR